MCICFRNKLGPGRGGVDGMSEGDDDDDSMMTEVERRQCVPSSEIARNPRHLPPGGSVGGGRDSSQLEAQTQPALSS